MSTPRAYGDYLEDIRAAARKAQQFVAAMAFDDFVADEKTVFAVVCQSGRPDLAGDSLELVRAPTLLIAGGSDWPVIAMNQEAMKELSVEKRLEIVPGATHFFEEPGALDQVARSTTGWFERYFANRDLLRARGYLD